MVNLHKIMLIGAIGWLSGTVAREMDWSVLTAIAMTIATTAMVFLVFPEKP